MKKQLFGSILGLLAGCASTISVASQDAFRPPSVPLVACDPYFSIWSPADKLTDADTTHWTGKSQRLTSLVRIDGKTFRLMGKEPVAIPALPQTKLEVLPTRSIYTFVGSGVSVTMTFMTAALPEDLDQLSRPITYLSYECAATDGKSHRLETYFDAGSELTVNTPDQPVVWSSEKISGVTALKVGSRDQHVLAKSGDDLRIDWGYLYLAAANGQNAQLAQVNAEMARTTFAGQGKLSAAIASSASALQPASAAPVSALVFNYGQVGNQPATHWLMLAYDQIYAIQYMKKNLRPYWRRNGWEAADLLKASAKGYASLKQRCETFDRELMADLTRAGGANYAQLGALAYRQCFAAGVLVADGNGQPLQFCKENHSNGCISTSDVFYPMSPQFLLFGPSLAKSFIVPFMSYAASERWKFPFAPHDLGTYPRANGQVYGDGENGVNNQMPVEESGNLLCLFAAVAEMEGNANFAGLYWKQLEQWAGYLKEKGFDPEKQLCTDDFAGHLAHNMNLSIKAICGLGSFAKLCELRGDKAKADEYFQIAREFAQRWVKEANDGDHYRLALDKPGSWSQKYNLVWDKVLGLNLFPAEVARKEMDYYKKMQNEYGLPLDNRETYTKLDWITWTASLTQDRNDFDTLVTPIIHFLNTTPDRSPMTDWYQTKSARKVGFTARPVVGGVFMQMLYDKAIWQKYAKRDLVKAANWAAIPQLPKVTIVVPAADKAAAKWSYTTATPGADWAALKFDASSWPEGFSGFGVNDTPGAIVATVWNSSDIWMRREVEIAPDTFKDLHLWFHHDDDAEVYINGVLALDAGGFVGRYDFFPLTEQGRAALKPGKNLVAVHCHQTGGGQYVDLGFVDVSAN